MEQDTGVEPAFTAWEAVVLPIYESCICEGIIAKGDGKCNNFLSEDIGVVYAPGVWNNTNKSIGRRKTHMAEYELVHEIQNLCRNNQMRDVFFEEIDCDDPVEYARQKLRGKQIELSVSEGAGGSITIYAGADGLNQMFLFTPID